MVFLFYCIILTLTLTLLFFLLFQDGVHHYDEFGLRNIHDEPPEILKIHKEMIYFVKEWLKEFDSSER